MEKNLLPKVLAITIQVFERATITEPVRARPKTTKTFLSFWGNTYNPIIDHKCDSYITDLDNLEF